jgi:hypothetical protein
MNEKITIVFFLAGTGKKRLLQPAMGVSINDGEWNSQASVTIDAIHLIFGVRICKCVPTP